MALRKIRVDEDEILRKHSREIPVITDKVKTLVNDMYETMYEADGIGLAAVQVGILKRVFVIDIGQGPICFINPEVTVREGEQDGVEGCLSIPGKSGHVKRPNLVKIKALDVEGKPFELKATEFYARVICHEYDHLDGVLYTDIATDMITEEEE